MAERGKAAAGMGWPFGPLVQLLALTAQRREGVAGMTWEEIDIDRALWTIPNWTVHDLRRTATTGMAQLRIPPHVTDKVLNHKSGSIRGVAAVYNRRSYLDERRGALEMWGKRVMSLVERAPIPVPNETRHPSPTHHEERG